jgi:transposase
MARSTPNQYQFALTDEQRERYEAITRTGSAPVSKVRHARVLLLSDANRVGGKLTRDQIAEALGMHVNTVDRLRKRYVLEGEEPVLNRKPRETPPVPPKIDGRVEAHLVAICCGPKPDGRTRWTLSLLSDELKRRGLVASVCLETVRKALKKTTSNPGGSNAGAFRNGIRPASSPRWKTSSTCTLPSTRRRSH